MKRFALGLLGMLGAIASPTASAYCINASDVTFEPAQPTAGQDVGVRLRAFGAIWDITSPVISVVGSTVSVSARNITPSLPPPQSSILVAVGPLLPGQYSVVLSTTEGTGPCPPVTVPLVVTGGQPDAVAAPTLSPLWLALMAAMLALVGWVGLRRT
jgi:hypothetical protein